MVGSMPLFNLSMHIIRIKSMLEQILIVMFNVDHKEMVELQKSLT